MYGLHLLCSCCSNCKWSSNSEQVSPQRAPFATGMPCSHDHRDSPTLPPCSQRLFPTICSARWTHHTGCLDLRHDQTPKVQPLKTQNVQCPSFRFLNVQCPSFRFLNFQCPSPEVVNFECPNTFLCSAQLTKAPGKG